MLSAVLQLAGAPADPNHHMSLLMQHLLGWNQRYLLIIYIIANKYLGYKSGNRMPV